MFKSLSINGWRQYEEVNIDFHDQLTIITGANGAGKTTLLNMLNQHFGGMMFTLVGVPKIESAGLIYNSGFWRARGGFLNVPGFSHPTIQPHIVHHMHNNGMSVIGKIEYSNGGVTDISIPATVGSTYNFHYNTQQPVSGLAIASHRPFFKYEQVTTIPTTAITDKRSNFDRYKSSFYQRYHNGQSRNETFFIKETLISLAAFSYGNKLMQQNDKGIQLFEGFEAILKKVLPPTLGFKSLEVRIPEVVLCAETGEFPIDAVSGGIAAIIDLAWQIYMYENNGQRFVVTIDEPENHLHPEIQKIVLPNMIKAFPQCQFIVTTHSPFIISSMPNSNAYALKYNHDKKIVSVLLDRVDKAGTANEILREVLGLDDTMPNWVDEKIEAIIDKYKETGIGKDNIENFKQELISSGLGKYVSGSLVKLITEYKSDRPQ